MYKIGITGATGFVGSNLVDFLESLSFLTKAIGRAELANGKDIDLPFDVVIHLAGKAHDLKRASDPASYYEVNFELTKKLFDAFLISKATKFIFVSSVKASADTLDGILTEEEAPNPQTDYGKSKLMAEEYILSQKLPSGKSFYILRPCMIHGPGNKGNLNLLYNVVKRGIPYPLAAFDNSRSFLSIDNLNFVIETLIVNDSVLSGVYNLADDEPLSTTEVITLITQVDEKSPKLWRIRPSFIRAVAKIGDWLRLPLNSERLKKLTESYIVSNDKIKSALNIAHLPVTSKMGLLRTILSFKSR